jgi:hypothetical protein
MPVVNNNTVLQVRSLSLTSVPTPGVKHKSFRIFAAAAAATALSVLILSYMGGGGGVSVLRDLLYRIEMLQTWRKMLKGFEHLFFF